MKKQTNKCKGQIVLYTKAKKERKPLNRVDYLEEKITEKSIEIFNDKNPCIIRKTHSIMSLCLELIDIVEQNNLNNKEIQIEENNIVWNYLDESKFLDKGITKIKII